MRSLLFTILFLLATNTNAVSTEKSAVSEHWTIWSALPATSWEHAFVTGNGRHGMMISGKPNDERITCVHEELFIRDWDHRKPTVPITSHLMPEVRRLMNEGQTDEASKLLTSEADRQLKEMGAHQRWPLIPHPAFDLRIETP